jgi:glycosyltransferase involved in cell wall biosynthesis
MKLKTGKMVYLRTDVYELFPNVNYDVIREYDQKLKANADLTLLVSNALHKQESAQCRKSLYLDHGVDYEMFAAADKNLSRPEDIKSINRPVIGYFGSIDSHTVDYELINKLAELLPEMSFVFVGKIYSRDSNLPANKNTWMLGQKPYELIPHYGKCFDVAIMPWHRNRWIEACNPIKLKEYLALGKPVVSTPFAELRKYRDVVYEAKAPEEFCECIRRAIAEDNPKLIAARREKVRHASWDSKAELVLEALFRRDYCFQEAH